MALGLRWTTPLVCAAAVLATLPQQMLAIPRHSKFSVTKGGVVELVEKPELRLNVKGGNMKEGDPLVLWPCSAHSHEIFDLVDGTIRSRQNPSVCLNAAGGPNMGTSIVTWPCAHQGALEKHEEFIFGADGRIRLRQHPDMCMNVKGGGAELGAELVLWPCGNGTDLFVHRDGLIELDPDKNLHLNIAGGNLTNFGSQVVLWRCEPAQHEIFEFTYPEYRMRLKHKPELCVNAEGGAEQGSRLIVWPCHAELLQHERFLYDSKRQVIHAYGIGTLAFNVKGGNIAVGGELILWTTAEEEEL